MQVSQDYLEKALSRAYRTDRLYPARLRALDLLQGRSYLTAVRDQIVTPLKAMAGSAIAAQFMRDFETYGLYEAIVYLHDLDLGDDPIPTLAEIVKCYENLAEAYQDARSALLNTDNPRVREILDALHVWGGESSHNYAAVHPPLLPPTAAETEQEERYLAETLVETPSDRAFEEMIASLIEEPPPPQPKRPDEAALDAIVVEWTFHGTPSMADLPFRLAEMLRIYGIHPLGSTGHSLLEQVSGFFNQEMFGDYDRWLYCSSCDGEFDGGNVRAETLAAVLRSGRWLCRECRNSDR